jgi:Zn-dependent metalloprotease
LTSQRPRGAAELRDLADDIGVQIGKDPQPASVQEMDAYKATNPSWNTKDHGGVHIFSGIPNKAFVLSAEAFDGYSWEKAGKIWWTTITTGRISSKCTFIQFADATVDVAHELFNDAAAKTVRDAWNEVGVVRKN